MSCRTGCKTRDHESYAACLRDAAVQAAPMWTNSKAINAELGAYRDARKEGIQPASTKARDIENAVRISDATGVAYKAG